MLMIERPQIITGDYNREAQIKVYTCPNCGSGVAHFHRYCWYCGTKLEKPQSKNKTKAEKRDICEIHHSGEPQLSELCTYGRNAQFVESRAR